MRHIRDLRPKEAIGGAKPYPLPANWRSATNVESASFILVCLQNVGPKDPKAREGMFANTFLEQESFSKWLPLPPLILLQCSQLIYILYLFNELRIFTTIWLEVLCVQIFFYHYQYYSTGSVRNEIVCPCVWLGVSGCVCVFVCL